MATAEPSGYGMRTEDVSGGARRGLTSLIPNQIVLSHSNTPWHYYSSIFRGCRAESYNEGAVVGSCPSIDGQDPVLRNEFLLLADHDIRIRVRDVVKHYEPIAVNNDKIHYWDAAFGCSHRPV
jgi:hypothetical protein